MDQPASEEKKPEEEVTPDEPASDSVKAANLDV